MKRFCVFCGSHPENKTLEHVIPSWLIKMTGDPKRKWTVGINWETKKPIEFSAKNFKFPSCAECNNYYSSLEENSKKILQNILNSSPVSAQDYDVFLDWFDKIRIGTWLGCQQLGTYPHTIKPKFHISSRIGTKDRSLFIYRINSEHKGFHLFGAESPVFGLFPCSFGMIINGYVFINISMEALHSARLGLPYPKIMEDFVNNDGFLVTKMDGWHSSFKAKTPVIRKNFYRPLIEIHQPIMFDFMLKNVPSDELSMLTQQDFCRRRQWMDEKYKVHKVFDGAITVCEEHDLIYESPCSVKSFRPGNEYIKLVYEVQNQLANEYYTSSRSNYLPKEDKKLRKVMLNWNQGKIDYLQSLKEER